MICGWRAGELFLRMLKKAVQQGRRGLSILLRGGWDDSNFARPTRGVLDRALREQGDRLSYPTAVFCIRYDR